MTIIKKLLITLITFTMIFSDCKISCEIEINPYYVEEVRLMDSNINSLYIKKELFLRELISCASDAIDKIRFYAMSEPDVLGQQTELYIKIQYDEDKNIVEIIDSGIGMTKNELIDNLDVQLETDIFLENVKARDLSLMRQLGEGFYSALLVASKVEIISKSNDDIQHRWTFSASNSSVIEEDNSIILKRGTIVRLYLKEDASQYAQYEKLKNIILKYCIQERYPIYLQKTVTNQETVQKTDAQMKAEIKRVTEELKAMGKYIDEKDVQNSISKTRTIQVNTIEFQNVTENIPMWIRRRGYLEEDQYQQIYKNNFNDSSNPLTWSHFRAEGDLNMIALLFIPRSISFQQFNERKSEMKLYNRGVLTNHQSEDLLPQYLNFIKYIVDFDNFSLNFTDKNDHFDDDLKPMKRKMLQKAVDLLVYLNPDDEEASYSQYESETEDSEKKLKSFYDRKVDKFNKFWKNFQKNIKLGVIQDHANRDKLADLTRWYTTNNISELISLDDYINRMKQGQKEIYFLGGSDRELMKELAVIQGFVETGYEVILGDDPLDENLIASLKNYKTYKIANIATAGFIKLQNNSNEVSPSAASASSSLEAEHLISLDDSRVNIKANHLKQTNKSLQL